MQEQIEVLTVGRANTRSQSDIEVPASEDTVGRRHAEITIGTNGDCYIVDRGSSNGTFIVEKGKWKKIQQTSLALNTPLRLGSYETTIAALLEFRRRAMPDPRSSPPMMPPPPSAAKGKPRRNPATGEVE